MSGLDLKEIVCVWTGITWFIIGTSGGLLWKR